MDYSKENCNLTSSYLSKSRCIWRDERCVSSSNYKCHQLSNNKFTCNRADHCIWNNNDDYCKNNL